MGMGAASAMHISIWTMVVQIAALAFWLFLIVSIVILVINSHKNRRSLQKIEAYLKEINQNKDDRHTLQ